MKKLYLLLPLALLMLGCVMPDIRALYGSVNGGRTTLYDAGSGQLIWNKDLVPNNDLKTITITLGRDDNTGLDDYLRGPVIVNSKVTAGGGFSQPVASILKFNFDATQYGLTGDETIASFTVVSANGKKVQSYKLMF